MPHISLQELLDLDTEKRKDAPPPFAVKVASKKYELVSPGELTLAETDSITSSLDALVVPAPAKQRDALRAALRDIPSWKVNLLVRKYMEHYGMTPPVTDE